MPKIVYEPALRGSIKWYVFKPQMIKCIIAAAISAVCAFIPVVGWIISLCAWIYIVTALIGTLIGLNMMKNLTFALTETGIFQQAGKNQVSVSFDQVTSIQVRDDPKKGRGIVIETTLPAINGKGGNMVIDHWYLADPDAFLAAYKAQEAKVKGTAE